MFSCLNKVIGSCPWPATECLVPVLKSPVKPAAGLMHALFRRDSMSRPFLICYSC